MENSIINTLVRQFDTCRGRVRQKHDFWAIRGGMFITSGGSSTVIGSVDQLYYSDWRVSVGEVLWGKVGQGAN